MNFDSQLIQFTIPIAGAIITIGGAFLTIQNIRKNMKEEKEAELAKILYEAKEEMALIKADLDSRINETKIQLVNLESSVNKDLDHMKETYSGEIRNLALKIEDLRNELRSQHGSMVSLLTKMIETKS